MSRQFRSAFDGKLIVWGGRPDRRVNSMPGVSARWLRAGKAGAYLVEPTSFLSFNRRLHAQDEFRVPLGPRANQRRPVYSGFRPVALMRFFDNSSRASPGDAGRGGVGAFTKVSLPLGTYFVDAFKDTAGAAGLTPLIRPMASATPGPGHLPGVPVVAIGTCVADPATASSGSGDFRRRHLQWGAVGRSGTLFPLGSNAPVGFCLGVRLQLFRAIFGDVSLEVVS